MKSELVIIEGKLVKEGLEQDVVLIHDRKQHSFLSNPLKVN